MSSTNMSMLMKEEKLRRYILPLLYIFVFFSVLFNSGHVLSTLDSNLHLYLVLFTSFTLFIFVFNSRIIRSKLFFSSSFLLIVMVSYVMSFIVNFSPENAFSFMTPVSMMLFSFSIVSFVRIKNMAKYLVYSMVIVTIVSVLGRIIVFEFGILDLFPILTSKNGIEYHNLSLFYIIKGSQDEMSRNLGFFWEPGIYATFLLVAILVNNFIHHSKFTKFVFFSILVIGVVSTKSTAGYMLLVLVFLIMLSFSKKGYFLLSISLITFLFLMTFLWWEEVAEFLLLLDYNTFSKVIELSVSSSTRLNAPLLNMQIFLEKPFFGYGFHGANLRFQQEMQLFSVFAQTSTSTYYLAATGFLGLLYSYAWVYSIFKLKKINLYSRLLILLFVLLVINKEPHAYNLLTYIILFYLLEDSYTKRNKGY